MPDETTVCKFRQLLEEHWPAGSILGTVTLYLQTCEVRTGSGTIAHATIIYRPEFREEHSLGLRGVLSIVEIAALPPAIIESTVYATALSEPAYSRTCILAGIRAPAS